MISIPARAYRIRTALQHRDRLAMSIGDHLLAVQERFLEVSPTEAAARYGFTKFLNNLGLSQEDAERFLDLRQER